MNLERLDVNDPENGDVFAFIRYVILRYKKSPSQNDREFLTALKETWAGEISEEMISNVRSVMQSFTEREVEFACLYGKGYKLEEIGRMYRRSKQRVCQIFVRIERKLEYYAFRIKLTSKHCMYNIFLTEQEASRSDYMKRHPLEISIYSIGLPDKFAAVLSKAGLKMVENCVRDPDIMKELILSEDESVDMSHIYESFVGWFERTTGTSEQFLDSVLLSIRDRRKLPIEWMGLPTRLANPLRRSGFTTAQELSQASVDSLMHIRGFGPTYYFAVFANMRNLNLKCNNWVAASMESVGLDSDEWTIEKVEHYDFDVTDQENAWDEQEC